MHMLESQREAQQTKYVRTYVRVRMLLGLWFRAGQMGVSGTSRDMYWFEARQNQWPIFLQMSKQTQPECIECLTIMDHTWTRRHHDKHQEQLADERYAQVSCERASKLCLVRRESPARQWQKAPSSQAHAVGKRRAGRAAAQIAAIGNQDVRWCPSSPQSIDP